MVPVLLRFIARIVWDVLGLPNPFSSGGDGT